MVQPFHAYANGNIGWEPAFEVEAASAAMALRTWKEEPTLQPAAAQARLRGSIHTAIQVLLRCSGSSFDSRLSGQRRHIPANGQCLAEYQLVAQLGF